MQEELAEVQEELAEVQEALAEALVALHISRFYCTTALNIALQTILDSLKLL